MATRMRPCHEAVARASGRVDALIPPPRPNAKCCCTIDISVVNQEPTPALIIFFFAARSSPLLSRPRYLANSAKKSIQISPWG